MINMTNAEWELIPSTDVELDDHIVVSNAHPPADVVGLHRVGEMGIHALLRRGEDQHYFMWSGSIDANVWRHRPTSEVNALVSKAQVMIDGL